MYKSHKAETSQVEVVANDKRERFEALPTLEVNSTEVKSLGHGQGFTKRTLEWLTQKDVFGDYRNIDKEWDVTFNRTGARNVIVHGAGEGKIALLERVPELIENGIYLETVSKSNGLDSHIFAAKATIDGRPCVIGFVVREDSNGKRYYDHAIRIESGDRAETSLRATETTDGNLPENPNTLSNIVQKHLKVNSKTKIRVGKC
jgi:hypothetical protein